MMAVVSLAPAAFGGSDLSHGTIGPQNSYSGIKPQQATQTDRDVTKAQPHRNAPTFNPRINLQQGDVQSDSDRAGRFNSFMKPC
jgi:hypothetical protein